MSHPIDKESLVKNLRGEGLEIGAFHSPFQLPAGTKVRYVDLVSSDESRRLFPEATEGGRSLVEPDILSPADQLPMVADQSQDFLIAAHLLEHTRDPIGTLIEWHRVLKPGGHLVLVLPDMRHTFDRGRERTGLLHLVEDHALREDQAAMAQRDRRHYEEWAREVSGISDPERQKIWADLLELANYPIHYHCFWPEDIDALIAHLNTAPSGSLKGPARYRILEALESEGAYEFGHLLEAL